MLQRTYRQIRRRTPKNLLDFIAIPSMFKTWTLQPNVWTHGCFENL